jgi:hypothetical protein
VISRIGLRNLSPLTRAGTMAINRLNLNILYHFNRNPRGRMFQVDITTFYIFCLTIYNFYPLLPLSLMHPLQTACPGDAKSTNWR